jgi:hypothetical protein
MPKKDSDPPDLFGSASKHGTVNTGWTCQQLNAIGGNTGYFLTAPQTKEGSEDER